MQSNYRKWTLLGLGWQVVGMWEILEMIRRKHSCTLLIGSFWGSSFGAGVPELGASLPAQLTMGVVWENLENSRNGITIWVFQKPIKSHRWPVVV